MYTLTVEVPDTVVESTGYVLSNTGGSTTTYVGDIEWKDTPAYRTGAGNTDVTAQVVVIKVDGTLITLAAGIDDDHATHKARPGGTATLRNNGVKVLSYTVPQP